MVDRPPGDAHRRRPERTPGHSATFGTLLSAWDDRTDSDPLIIRALVDHFDRLRTTLAMRVPKSSSTDSLRQPKGTKQTLILGILRGEEGAIGPKIVEAMGWAPHTVRGFLAGLVKKGIAVEVLERVR
jgi:hypothetical protein